MITVAEFLPPPRCGICHAALPDYDNDYCQSCSDQWSRFLLGTEKRVRLEETIIYEVPGGYEWGT